MDSGFTSIRLEEHAVVLLDQRALPAEERYLELRSAEDVALAIEDMAVRGAPAIGVAAAMAVAIELVHAADDELQTSLERVCARLARTRPTAVNLRWALDRMRGEIAGQLERGEDAKTVRAVARRLAQRILDEEVERCRAIGEHGAELVERGARLLTHCNTGALATGGYGTALGIVRSAARAGRLAGVFVSETRPLLQGSRLTAWELARDGIPFQLIGDSMAGALMARGQVDLVVVGADRIAANGDVANKIGTYGLAILAHAHDIPFYVAAPLSSIDLGTPSGDEIPIEERSPDELLYFGSVRVAPVGVAALNPAFDVTPAKFVTAIVTERGILRPPYGPGLKALYKGLKAQSAG